MKQRVIYVMTHDSIGLGEDGPTHQPVEHLAALRAIPACSCSALPTSPKRPRHGNWRWSTTARRSSPVPAEGSGAAPPDRRELLGHGGYIFRPAMDERKVTLISSGTELSLAVEAQEELEREHGIPTAVVSLISWELFEQQPRTTARKC